MGILINCGQFRRLHGLRGSITVAAIRGRGGIGRRGRLKICFPIGSVGSSPAARTTSDASVSYLDGSSARPIIPAEKHRHGWYYGDVAEVRPATFEVAGRWRLSGPF